MDQNGSKTLTAAAWRYLRSGGMPADFVVSAALELPTGTATPDVERALEAIAIRHEALTAHYVGGSSPMYIVSRDDSIRGGREPLIDLRSSSVDWDWRDESLSTCVDIEIAENVKRLDPEHGRQLAAAYVGVPNSRPILLLTVHHLAVDGVSWHRLIREVDLELQGSTPVHPPSVSCGQWVKRLRETPPRSQAVVDYWHALAVESKTLTGVSGDCVELSGSLEGHAVVNIMRTLPRRLGATPADLMLAAFGLSIHRVLGLQPTILVQGHGRYAQLFKSQFDVTSTVGWLADDYPVKILDSGASLDPLRGVLANLPCHPEDYTLCYYYCDETADSFADYVPPKAYFNYWGHVSHRSGSISIPDVPLNRMEIGNASKAELALQVRTRETSDGLLIEWVLNGCIGADAAGEIGKKWVEVLSGEMSGSSEASFDPTPIGTDAR